jgi:alpha-D-xyloside xylohydrolase
MDFPGDAAARDLVDQYMFGPAFLVSPVTEYKARSRRVYLPAGTDWYDFWTGKPSRGGLTIQADAPYDSMPLFVRAGSIVPVGAAQEYAGENDGRELTLYVYAGRDGNFSIYEDDGSSYGYERGQFSRIPIAWSDGSRTLRIGTRTGSFAGMPPERTFNVVLVTRETPVGYTASAVGTRVTYRGRSVQLDLQKGAR